MASTATCTKTEPLTFSKHLGLGDKADIFCHGCISMTSKNAFQATMSLEYHYEHTQLDGSALNPSSPRHNLQKPPRHEYLFSRSSTDLCGGHYSETKISSAAINNSFPHSCKTNTIISPISYVSSPKSSKFSPPPSFKILRSNINP